MKKAVIKGEKKPVRKRREKIEAALEVMLQAQRLRARPWRPCAVSLGVRVVLGTGGGRSGEASQRVD